MASTLPCPVCDRPVKPRGENRSFPFCSDRCRLIDLSKWLGGDYRIAGPRLGDGDGEPFDSGLATGALRDGDPDDGGR